MPRNANGTVPAASATARAAQRGADSEALLTETAVASRSAAAAVANTAADASRAPNRTPGPTGSVLRYASHGETRSTAIPTPNWKNATPMTAKPANVAVRAVASTRPPDVAKKRKNTVGT